MHKTNKTDKIVVKATLGPLLNLGKVFLLLGLIPIAHNLVEAEVGVGTIAEPHRSRSSRYLLHHQHVFQVAQARATILNWEEWYRRKKGSRLYWGTGGTPG